MSSVSSNKARPSSRGVGNRASSAAGSEASSRHPAPRSANTKKAKKPSKGSADELRAKEEEYMRINAELEAKTSELVREAEELLKGDLSALIDEDVTNDPPPNDSPHTHSPHLLLSNLLDNDPLTSEADKNHQQRPSTTVATSTKPPASTTRPHSSAQSRPHSKPPVQTHSRPSTQARPHSKAQKQQRPNSRLSTQGRLHSKPSDIRQVDSISADIDSTVDRLERGLDLGESYEDDILPQAAEDMGPEATIRFLKAKLRVMQEEMDRLCQENKEKDKALSQTEHKLKEVSEQASKAQRAHQSLTSQMDKYKQLSETLKHKSEGLETQLVSLRKELDGVKGSQRKAASQHSTVEVRLNRALEETERYKAALHKATAELKDLSKQDKVKLEQLSAENKQLERQKTELLAVFRRQMKLIEILKRQKMHIEAAKMLSFTEEEFVKALDWGTS